MRAKAMAATPLARPSSCNATRFVIAMYAHARLQFMYEPIVQTLLIGARRQIPQAYASCVQFIAMGSPQSSSLRKWKNARARFEKHEPDELSSTLRRLLSPRDVLVWVGTRGSDLVPFKQLGMRGVRTVLYQTEPLARGLCRHRARGHAAGLAVVHCLFQLCCKIITKS